MTELTKQHIETLVKRFYDRVREDDMLGPIFNDVAKVDWDRHIPLICQFWNSVMLKTQEYRGNPYVKHIMLGEMIDIQETHFERWLSLFKQEAIKHLPPEAAGKTIEKASMIATSLKYGMLRTKLPLEDIEESKAVKRY